jgi:hypothetical protein
MTGKRFDDLNEIPEAIHRLQQSSRPAIPLALLGLAATLVAAGISSYYAFRLSAELKIAEQRLDQTTSELSATRVNLNLASAALKRLEASSPSAADQRDVQAALKYVDRSEQNLAQASTSLVDAAAKLPTTGTSDARWFTVIASYSMGEGGLGRANALADAVTQRGACAEIWQTKISRNYAVVLNGPTDAKTASAAATQARSSGLARDAFPQRDREWARVGQRVCAKGA